MATKLDNLVVQEQTPCLPPHTHSAPSAANLVLSMGRRETGKIALCCYWSPWRLVAPSQGTCLTSFQVPSSLTIPWGPKSACFAQEVQPLVLSWGDEQQAGHAEWPRLMDQRLYGPSGPVGKQVHIDHLWDKCLLKEQGKARGNYFLSWSGEKNIVTRLESGRAQWHMWAHGMSMDFGFSKTCESPRFSGVRTSTLCAYTKRDHLCPRAWLVLWEATSKRCLTSALPTDSSWSPVEGGAFTCTSRGTNPPPISSQD